MSRKNVRWVLVGMLIISAGFAAWSWLRPYEWSADERAACRITGCQVVQDHSNYWVKLQLKMNKGAEHDDQKPIKLVTASDREIDTADVTLVSEEGQKTSLIWLKFWLEKDDIKGPLKLRINEGELTVRTGSGQPKLSADGSRYYVTNSW